jgi:glycosyltransferase involved in cell wall biosynthesis
MSEVAVTVAIPVRDGGRTLEQVLQALARQTVEHELVVCDSGSCDGSQEIARAHGARLIEISPAAFSHGGTRNLLMNEARGAHVAMLTQDAEPADIRWLETLLQGFELAEDVGIVCGAYRPRVEASLAVSLELERWFRALAPDGEPRLERLSELERGHQAGPGLPVGALIGPRGFFTDANACLARRAWERVPFRDVPYAEDRVLAIDMLRAGYAKAYLPSATVLHSHEYGALEELRRCFDEWRGLLEVYAWREPASPSHVIRRLRGELGAARRTPTLASMGSSQRRSTLVAIGRHNVVRLAGALLGSRADLLPPFARRALSLERRASFTPVDLDKSGAPLMAPQQRHQW